MKIGRWWYSGFMQVIKIALTVLKEERNESKTY
jgi:hypothetical protein